jgi:hypothetical protein
MPVFSTNWQFLTEAYVKVEDYYPSGKRRCPLETQKDITASHALPWSSELLRAVTGCACAHPAKSPLVVELGVVRQHYKPRKVISQCDTKSRTLH